MMERYIFFLNGGEFIFHSLGEFTGFVDLLFEHATDRRAFYADMLSVLSQAVEIAMADATEEGTVAMVDLEEPIAVLYSRYGAIYDPDHEFVKPKGGFIYE